MPRLARIATLLLIIGTGWAIPAQADYWDWLADLSGPGAFNTRGNLSSTIYCRDLVKARANQAAHAWFQLVPEGGPCISAEWKGFRSEKDDPQYFATTRADIVQGVIGYRPHAAFEAGLGFGFIRLNSKLGGQVKTHWRPVGDVVRLLVRPLLLIPKLRNNLDWGFIQFSVRESVMFGELNQDDFFPRPGTAFKAKNDAIRSMGFSLDLTPLARGFKRLF